MGYFCFVIEDIYIEYLQDCREDNFGGVASRLWYAPAHYFSVVVPSDEHFTNLESTRTVEKTMIKLLGGKKLKYIDAYIDNNAISEKTTGTARKLKLVSELKFAIRKMNARNLGFVKQFRNEPLIFFVKDNNGQTWVIGDLKNACYLTAYDSTTATTVEDDNILNFTFTANTELHIMLQSAQYATKVLADNNSIIIIFDNNKLLKI